MFIRKNNLEKLVEQKAKEMLEQYKKSQQKINLLTQFNKECITLKWYPEIEIMLYDERRRNEFISDYISQLIRDAVCGFYKKYQKLPIKVELYEQHHELNIDDGHRLSNYMEDDLYFFPQIRKERFNINELKQYFDIWLEYTICVY